MPADAPPGVTAGDVLLEECAACGGPIVDEVLRETVDVSTGFGHANQATIAFCDVACRARYEGTSVVSLQSRQTRLWQWEVGLDYIDLLYRRLGPDGRLDDDRDPDGEAEPAGAGDRQPADA